MTPRTLGYAVLAYAALTSVAALSLVKLAFGQWRFFWLELGEATAWLALVAGGYGLVLGRSWSRSVALFAAAASGLISALGTIALWWVNPDPAILVRVLGSLPPMVLLFVLVRRLPPPERWTLFEPFHGVRPSSTPRIDLAYACFAWVAFVFCAAPIASFIPVDITTAQVVGMIIGIPVLLATLAVGGIALVLSIIEWSIWPLKTMSLLIASLLLLFLAWEEWNVVGANVVFAWYGISTAILVGFCVRWFAFARRRALSTPPFLA
jgi:hypothetical protein